MGHGGFVLARSGRKNKDVTRAGHPVRMVRLKRCPFSAVLSIDLLCL